MKRKLNQDDEEDPAFEKWEKEEIERICEIEVKKLKVQAETIVTEAINEYLEEKKKR